MKLNLFVAVFAGATLGQVAASPLRVVVVTSSNDAPAAPNLRFGHAIADSPVAKLALPTQSYIKPVTRRPCGKHIKEKFIGMSNAFRAALGLPLIETAQSKAGQHIHGGMIHIMPFVGTPSMDMKPAEDNYHSMSGAEMLPHEHVRIHKVHKWGKTFCMRIHNALMALGPWEGRAVAFVLGCGIGVLLRMFWVLTIVTYRTIRGERDDEYTVIEEYNSAEDVVVPPPTYTIIDEKDQIKIKDAQNADGN
ncbi:hypothetical protein AGABI2DRAFT_196069 [Agaricus bisporus var. bisporus H97]|uniref:hypothetical protein n=1 Tax=Agaricus bisporus var. bisporus (strain H97 / ATCC MYA-4626 / FGSC 10389) TaxID=936046 RepID=UPI00029F53CA|nr:hypothetical protein AGABI2DRAFT_196069 [Agaricus bisporus var. bisporus H97]EKV42050.1 hypothetical protein AGABI2DRAFT_196069 [Agaricus bisporus var. bisporus H97]